jgi:SAM-dependent methyltransferase
MNERVDSGLEYNERRADEYDATSWEHARADRAATERLREVLGSLVPARTLDVGCGTGFLGRWLPGPVTLLDASPAMLAIAGRRLPGPGSVRCVAPPLPFVSEAFGRAFTANLYGHLGPALRSRLVAEMLRVAGELVIVEQLASSGEFVKSPEVLMDGPFFAIVRRRG